MALVPEQQAVPYRTGREARYLFLLNKIKNQKSEHDKCAGYFNVESSVSVLRMH